MTVTYNICTSQNSKHVINGIEFTLNKKIKIALTPLIDIVEVMN